MANRTHYPVRARASELILLDGTFETNSTSNPDGATGDISSVSRADTGDLVVTMKNAYKQFLFMAAVVEEDDANMFVKVTGSSATAGTVNLTTYTNSAGTISAADTNDKTVRLVVFARNTALTSR